MQDTKTKADINLIQFHKITSRHVLVLEADVDERDRRKLIHISNIIRIAGNELTAIMKKNYEQLTRTKKYRCLQDMYAKAKKADNKEQMKTIASDMNEMQKSYNLTWEYCQKAMVKINKRYQLNSIFALSKAEDVWRAIEKCLFSDGKTVHFKKYGDYPEIRARQRNRGIVISADDNGMKFKLGNIVMRPIVNKPKHTKTRRGNGIKTIESHDIFAEMEIESIIRYLENPEVFDETALQLYNQKGIIMDTYRPCYASVSFKEIRGKIRVFIHISIEGTAKTKFNKDGTRRHQYGKGFIGCDIGPQSIAYTSKEEVGLKNLAERGAAIKTSKKRHGKSIKNRCPGYFQAQAKAKFERTGGVYIEVPITYRASQYDHTCNKYIKKALSQRMYELADRTRVQRDWYSSFLMYCIGTDLQNISRYKCKRYFDELYAKYLELEQYIINNKITVMNSGIKFKAA